MRREHSRANSILLPSAVVMTLMMFVASLGTMSHTYWSTLAQVPSDNLFGVTTTTIRKNHPLNSTNIRKVKDAQGPTMTEHVQSSNQPFQAVSEYPKAMIESDGPSQNHHEVQIPPGMETSRRDILTKWQSLVSFAASDSTPFLELPHILSNQTIDDESNNNNNSTRVDLDITLVSFVAQIDMLDLLPGLVSRWSGPLSIAIYIDSEAQIHTFARFVSQHLSIFRQTRFHILLSKPNIHWGIPENRLRNLALNHTDSDYFLLLDNLDFVPNPGIYPNLVSVLQTNYRVRAALNERKLLALPAFEYKNGTDWHTFSSVTTIPHDKTELLAGMTNGTIVMSPMPNASLVSDAMDFNKWKRPTPGSMYITEWKKDFQPFVLARREGLPGFWPGFQSPKYAQKSWWEELYERYYAMGVLREHFAFRVRNTVSATHNPQQDDEEYDAFRRYLHDTYVEDPTLATRFISSNDESGSNATCNQINVSVPMHSSAHEKLKRELLCEWVNFSSSHDYRRQYPQVISPSNTLQSNISLSLALHGSVDRLDKLIYGIQRWGGPVSVAIYVDKTEAIERLFQFHNQHTTLLENATFHLFFEKLLSQNDRLYPHNYLRNLAMDYSKADHILLCDMDFVTNQDAYQTLLALLEARADLNMKLENNTVFVLPAFEHKRSGAAKESEEAPLNKTDLMQLVFDEKSAEPFHLQKYSAGHGPTNYSKWFSLGVPLWYDIQYEWGFEPYVLARRRGLPKFWTEFRGFGFNKQSWCEELARMGYKFAVLRDFFVFHAGKSSGMVETPDWVHYEYQRIFRPRLDRLYPTY